MRFIRKVLIVMYFIPVYDDNDMDKLEEYLNETHETTAFISRFAIGCDLFCIL